MDNKEIAAKIHGWAERLTNVHILLGREMSLEAHRVESEPTSPTLRELVKPVEAAIALQRLCQWEFCAQYHPVPYCNINALDVTIETGRLVEPPTGIVEKCKLCHALYDLAQKGKADGEKG